ncbi:MAG: hypothetical protein WDN49_16920 [Acetobacteraceae bacterium]
MTIPSILSAIAALAARPAARAARRAGRAHDAFRQTRRWRAACASQETLALDPRRRLHLITCDGRDVLLLTGAPGRGGWLAAGDRAMKASCRCSQRSCCCPRWRMPSR